MPCAFHSCASPQVPEDERAQMLKHLEHSRSEVERQLGQLSLTSTTLRAKKEKCAKQRAPAALSVPGPIHSYCLVWAWLLRACAVELAEGMGCAKWIHHPLRFRQCRRQLIEERLQEIEQGIKIFSRKTVWVHG